MKLRAVANRLRGMLPDIDIRDGHVYGGGALVAVGVWQVFPPAGFIVAGLLLLYLGLRRP